jgi:hypothetical protein
MRKIRLNIPKDPVLNGKKIIDISSWEKLSHEWRGTRDKVILRHPESGSFFLVKFPRYGSNEIYYELFNCYFGKSLGLKYADYFLCRYKGELCIASKSFLSVSSSVSNELWEMKELICRYATVSGLELKYGRHSDVLKEHNIDHILMILRSEFGESVLPDFFRMVAYDCLLGHGDRHWENYGVLVYTDHDTNDLGDFSFAPLYDTAYGYLLERDDSLIKSLFDEGTLDQEEWYDPKKKGLCKITLEGDIKASHIDLFKYILNNPDYRQYHKYLLEIVRLYDKKIVLKILKLKLFSTGLTQVRIDVIMKVLSMRHQILSKIIKDYSERLG